ncbi:MAG: FapA family protein [Oceanidesulfovibrio sp.]
MPYYLRHHFDPDFDYTQLRPRERTDGGVDHYDLGYVQNVTRGQLLAEIVDMENIEHEYDKRFILNEPVFPAGVNTMVDPENGRRLLAEVNGYVFRANGLIHVHDLLNVRRDVDFHTGNITFPGDIIVHGAVRSGFCLKARNIKVLDIIEGSDIRAGGSLLAQGGIKGQKKASLIAHKDMRAAFCENAQLTAGRNIRVDGAAMHCQLAAGENILVEDRLQGGRSIVGKKLLVRRLLGGGTGTTTSIILGQDPKHVIGLEMIKEELLDIEDRLEYYGEQITFGTAISHEYGAKIEQAQRRKHLLEKRQDELVEVIENPPLNPEAHQVIVEGEIRPGVTVSLGKDVLVIDDYRGPARIRLDNEGRLAVFDHIPAES